MSSCLVLAVLFQATGVAPETSQVGNVVGFEKVQQTQLSCQDSADSKVPSIET